MQCEMSAEIMDAAALKDFKDSSADLAMTIVALYDDLGLHGLNPAEDSPDKILRSVDSKCIGVNMDPANLVMVTADDPVQAVHTLKDYFVHTHTKDGVKLAECYPVQVYGAFADDTSGELGLDKLFCEVLLAEGNVDSNGYLTSLHDIGFNGFLSIELEVGEGAAKDIKRSHAIP